MPWPMPARRRVRHRGHHWPQLRVSPASAKAQAWLQPLVPVSARRAFARLVQGLEREPAPELVLALREPA